MTALIVFLVFVLVVFIFGMLLVVICYQRTKSIQRKEENVAATSEAPHLYAGSGYEVSELDIWKGEQRPGNLTMLNLNKYWCHSIRNVWIIKRYKEFPKLIKISHQFSGNFRDSWGTTSLKVNITRDVIDLWRLL